MGHSMFDRDLVPLFVLAWIASMVRVVGAFVRAETFGTEPTLALLFVLVLPCLLGKPGGRKKRLSRSRRVASRQSGCRAAH